MKSFVKLTLAMAAGLLVACGAADVEMTPDILATSEDALVTCTATCGTNPSISCQGNTCSATDGISVTCDGASTYCPDLSICQITPNTCDGFAGSACSRNRPMICCAQGVEKTCQCLLGTWWCS